MKTFLTIAVGLAIVAGFYKTHLALPYAGPLLWALIIWAIYAVIYNINKRRQIGEAAKRKEPIFVVALHPKTDEEIFTPEELQELIISVSYHRMAATVAALKKFHTDAKNGFMLRDKENERLPIMPIYPFHGENVNENWQEYNARAIDTARFIRAAWHKKLETHKEWYEKYHHQQQK